MSGCVCDVRLHSGRTYVFSKKERKINKVIVVKTKLRDPFSTLAIGANLRVLCNSQTTFTHHFAKGQTWLPADGRHCVDELGLSLCHSAAQCKCNQIILVS
jgi:hypothetical protein